jgi:hypothetical protein
MRALIFQCSSTANSECSLPIVSSPGYVKTTTYLIMFLLIYPLFIFFVVSIFVKQLGLLIRCSEVLVSVMTLVSLGPHRNCA